MATRKSEQSTSTHLKTEDSMNKKSFYTSIMVLALCGSVPACIFGGDADLSDPDGGGLSGPGNGSAQLTKKAAPTRGEGLVDAAPDLMHKTTKVPVVIDGVRYAPEDIHRFDGRPLYMM